MATNKKKKSILGSSLDPAAIKKRNTNNAFKKSMLSGGGSMLKSGDILTGSSTNKVKKPVVKKPVVKRRVTPTRVIRSNSSQQRAEDAAMRREKDKKTQRDALKNYAKKYRR